ncbi:hypothetical protein LBMAG42_03010 [Deltaproteobacteria bacterium]|nr:hypothetical protein LBMAG42_03010 [Deltaproteobacteria bacterium]
MFAFLIPMLALGALGCTDSALSTDFAGNGSDTAAEADSNDSGQDEDSADELPTAAWYSLQGTVAIRDGAAAAEGLSLHFVLADAALNAWDCAEMEVSSLQVVDPPPPDLGVELHAWWTLTVPQDTSCRETGLPLELGFGIGELSPEVRARLGTVDLEDAAERLYGAWMVADGAEPFPFGYAEGAAVESTDGPPPDGVYALEPLLVVALPPEE